jgi:hypothetical protein
MAQRVTIADALSRLNNSKTGWFLKIGVTVLFVYFVNKSVSARQILALTSHISISMIGINLLFLVVLLVLQVERWRIILDISDIHVSRHTAAKTLLFGTLYGFVTPARVGEFMRGVSIGGAKKSETALCVVVEKISAALVVVAAGCVAAIYHGQLFGYGRGQYALLIAAALVLTGCFILYELTGNTLPMRLQRIAIFAKLMSLAGPVRKQFTHKKAASVTMLSVIIYVLLICQTAFVFYFCGCGHFTMNCIYACEAYSFMMLCPFFIANMGIREFSFALFLAAGYGQLDMRAVSLSASLWILLVNIVLPACAGLVWWFYEAMMRSRLRQSRNIF